jgi:serine/threonine protein kinase
MGNPWEEEWVTVKSLGHGGQGKTYLVHSEKSPEKTAVLKVLKNQGSLQSRSRMRQEVVNLDILANTEAKVPRVLGHNTSAYKDSSVPLFVVMEFIEGKTLDQLIKERRRLPLDVAVRMTQSLCESIEIAHDNHVLHRDLKPENIIARDNQESEVVIVDYGLSFNSDDPGDLTQANENFRNIFLALPETNVPGGDKRDPRSDVTAACAVFYYLLTGNSPGQLHGSDGQPPHRRKESSIRDVLGDTSQTRQLELLFDRGFSTNIDSRFQSVAELIGRLALSSGGNADLVAEDPVEAARRASTILRQRDRPTQLKQYRGSAYKIRNDVDALVSRHTNQLGNFVIEYASVHPTGNVFPLGIDRVPIEVIVLRLRVQDRQHSACLGVGIGSRAEQCVVLMKDMVGDTGIDFATSDGWREVYWYKGLSDPESSTVLDALKVWMTEAIHNLLNQVLEGKEPTQPSSGFL